MKIDRSAEKASVTLRLVAMCLSPEEGGGFDTREVPRRPPAADEIEVAVAAASVNPIDVRRADGYGRRLLSLMGASRFPMTLATILPARSWGRASALRRPSRSESAFMD